MEPISKDEIAKIRDVLETALTLRSVGDTSVYAVEGHLLCIDLPRVLTAIDAANARVEALEVALKKILEVLELPIGGSMVQWCKEADKALIGNYARFALSGPVENKEEK